ncbi:MAG: hypothetical protein K5875_02705 [Saccharofermentans sp.]|nr:hypothetical protein [Saccharofermentans sp.]
MKESPYRFFDAANSAEDAQFPREVCTEYKILSEIETEIKNMPNISGKIKLFTELKCCDSCSDVIAQFLERHPNIEIEIIHNNDIRITK